MAIIGFIITVASVSICFLFLRLLFNFSLRFSFVQKFVFDDNCLKCVHFPEKDSLSCKYCDPPFSNLVEIVES